MTAEQERAACTNCNGEGWVCENHLTKPWGGGFDCCGGAGAPCPCCRLDLAGAHLFFKGRDEERAAIVKWLRERSDFNSMYVNSMLGGPNTIFYQGAYAALIGAAIDIDRGDHHKGE